MGFVGTAYRGHCYHPYWPPPDQLAPTKSRSNAGAYRLKTTSKSIMLPQGDNGAAAYMENFARLRASPHVLIGLWREQFRVSHFQSLRQHERLHVHELASVH